LKASSAEASCIAAGAVRDAKLHGRKPLKVLGIHVQDQAAGLARAMKQNDCVGLARDVIGPMPVWPPKSPAFI
jgi:hypothetical protein